MIIIIDCREKKPYKFPEDIKVVTKSLKTGDYSIEGFEELGITIERKEKKDIYLSLGRNRARFKREFERMQSFDYAAVVVESSLEDLLISPAFSQLNPKIVLNSLISWSIKYDVHVFFAGDRRYGRTLTYRILEKYWRDKNGK